MKGVLDKSATWWRPDVQALRGIAVLLVIAYHAELPVPGGFIGVDVFFVISGYVITGLVARRMKEHNFKFSEFFWRRFTRLVPALAIVIVTVQVLSALTLSPIDQQTSSAWMGIGSILFSANVVAYLNVQDYFNQGLLPNPLLNMWSLSVEEQFYIGSALILVVVMFLGKRFTKRNSKPLLLTLLSSLLIASLLLSVFSSFRTPGTLLQFPNILNPSFAFYSPFTRAWEFLIGSIVAIAAISVRKAAVRNVMQLSGIAVILLTALLLNKEIVFPGVVVILPVVATAFVLMAHDQRSVNNHSILNIAPLTFTGNISYSWYLWHWPFIIFAASIFGSNGWWLIGAAILSIIPAYLSYKLVENPMRRITEIRWKLIFAWVVPALGASVFLLFFSTNLWFNSSLASFKEQTSPVLNQTAACPELIDDYGMGSRICSWPNSSDKQITYLIGDSTAAQYGEMINSILKTESNLVSATHPGCPVYGVQIYWFEDNEFTPNVECNRFNQLIEQFLLDAPPSKVVIAASSVPFYATNIGVSKMDSVPSNELETKNIYLAEALPGFIRRLQEAGHSVILVQSTPAYFRAENNYSVSNQWRPQNCVGLNLLNIDTKCGQQVSINQLNKYQGPTRAVLEATALDSSTPLIDPLKSLCVGGSCSTNQGDIWFYVDGVHLNQNGIKKVRPEFEAALAQ